MTDPTDEPVPQAGLDREPAVRADLGGWISGPCLSPEALELKLPAWWPLLEPGQDWPAGISQLPTQ